MCWSPARICSNIISKNSPEDPEYQSGFTEVRPYLWPPAVTLAMFLGRAVVSLGRAAAACSPEWHIRLGLWHSWHEKKWSVVLLLLCKNCLQNKKKEKEKHQLRVLWSEGGRIQDYPLLKRVERSENLVVKNLEHVNMMSLKPETRVQLINVCAKTMPEWNLHVELLSPPAGGESVLEMLLTGLWPRSLFA